MLTRFWIVRKYCKIVRRGYPTSIKLLQLSIRMFDRTVDTNTLGTKCNLIIEEKEKYDLVKNQVSFDSNEK